MQLGDQVITTPAGAREIHFVLQSENQRVHGFSGCNRMMGGYVLDGAQAPVRPDGRHHDGLCRRIMELEKKFLAMFALVARWEISGETLRLLDADGKTLATFESRYLN